MLMGNHRSEGKSIWITWENQVRNHSMARLLGAKLYVIRKDGSRLKRYAYCIVLSMAAILKEKPDFLFVQNPSLVLNYLALLLRPLFRFRLVSDAHFAGVVAHNGSHLMQRLLDFSNSRADLVVVTNTNHAWHIEKIGGVPFICEDPLPELPEGVPSVTEDMDKVVFFICSFEIDEPYRDVFSAAAILQGEGYRLFVSGNYRKAGIDPNDYPHVEFLGYISYDLYTTYLKRSSVAVDLTKCEDLLLCGAYEAMAAEIPLVTSDTDALKKYFTHGATYTDEEPGNIADAIRRAYRDRDRLRGEILAWKARAVPVLAEKILKLKEIIERH